jgi:hypothetical protein
MEEKQCLQKFSKDDFIYEDEPEWMSEFDSSVEDAQQHQQQQSAVQQKAEVEQFITVGCASLMEPCQCKQVLSISKCIMKYYRSDYFLQTFKDRMKSLEEDEEWYPISIPEYSSGTASAGEVKMSELIYECSDIDEEECASSDAEILDRWLLLSPPPAAAAAAAPTASQSLPRKTSMMSEWRESNGKAEVSRNHSLATSTIMRALVTIDANLRRLSLHSPDFTNKFRNRAQSNCSSSGDYLPNNKLRKRHPSLSSTYSHDIANDSLNNNEAASTKRAAAVTVSDASATMTKTTNVTTNHPLFHCPRFHYNAIKRKGRDRSFSVSELY